ncbi:MAG: hypothetical protein ABL925_10860 [Methylococcales bacterium]
MNIVLAHGILGFDQIGSIYYFNGLKQHLENKHNAKVLITEVNPTASIVERGNQLKTQILAGLQNKVLDPDKPTHILAHSMGGLDSRYILSPVNSDNIGALITSLTTIGTPHRGSPIADLFYPLLDGKGSALALALWEIPARQFLNFFGISVAGLRDLTSEVLTAFDQQYEDHQDVQYFWTAGIGRAAPGLNTSLVLSLTYNYLYENGKSDEDKHNDGAVTLCSAKHGEAIGVPWLADHLDEVGHDLDHLPSGTPEHFPYLAKYDEILQRISQVTKPQKS